MTNPFNNPFGVPPPEPEPTQPIGNPFGVPLQSPESATPAIDPTPTAVPGPMRLVRKIGGWVLLVFGVLVVVAALVDWSAPGMSVGMTFFGAAFAVVGSTLIWQKLPWRIAGPVAGVLMVISLIIVGATDYPAAEADDAALSVQT